MDLQGKPAYNDADCPTCPKLKAGVCVECDKKIPQYATIGGAGPVTVDGGLVYPGVHHWHLKNMEGTTGYRAIRPAVDRQCYLRLFNEKYPDHPLTLEQLPRKINYT